MKGAEKELAAITGAVFALLVIISSMVILSSCDTTTAPDQRSVPVATVGTPTTFPTVPPPTIPPPVQTIEPPTSTPAPILPTETPAPLPSPPQATSLPLVTPIPDTPTPSAKVSGGSGLNIAWGVATGDDLTIWVGTYSDTPSPSISNSRAIVTWPVPLTLLDLAISPDHQSLAVLTVDAPKGDEGVRPTWLSVIDLGTNSVQDIPDYTNHYDLYEYYFYQSPSRILGWIDNNSLAIQQVADIAAAIAGKDGATYSRLAFPEAYTVAPETALSADHTTFFSLLTGVVDGLWLYNADGTNPRQIMSANTVKPLYHPVWSPDDRYISFLSPQIETHEESDLVNFQRINIWVLDPVGVSQQPIGTDAVWDVDPAWAPDSSTIAFLRADSPVTDDTLSTSYDNPTQVNTNIYTASTTDLTPHQLTSFQGVSNASLMWTAGGNLVLGSTLGSANPGTADGLPNLIEVSTKDGSATTLVSGSPGKLIERPVVFR